MGGKETEMDTEESEEVSESVETGGDDTSNPADTSDGDSNQPARLSLQFGPPKAHPAGPPPEDAKPSKSGPVPLMSLEVAPPPEMKQDEEKLTQEAPQVLQLPRALEEALAYKSERAEEMGVGPDT